VIPAVFWVAAPTIIAFAAVCATFYGIHYTNKINRRMQDDRLRTEDHRQNREMLRSKGEELYALINLYFVEFRNAAVTLTERVHQAGIIGLADSVDLNQNNARLLRIKMLASVYFPDCGSKLDLIDKCTEHLGSVITDLLKNPGDGRVDRMIKGVFLSTTALEGACQDLQKMIITEMQELHADVIRKHNASSLIS